jgi:hypothetical protein
MKTAKEFWVWFHRNEIRLHRGLLAGEIQILNEINHEFNEVNSDLGWEYGPVLNTEKLYFAISPEMSMNLLQPAYLIVSLAYQSAIWDFKLGRQTREWSDEILICLDESKQDNLSSVNLSDSVCRIQAVSNKKCDVYYHFPKIKSRDKSQLEHIAKIVCIGQLSETIAMLKVNQIIVEPKIEPRSEWSPVENLANLVRAFISATQ